MEKNIKTGQRIKMRREQLSMTQEELGNSLWLNKSTIQRYESGKIAKIKLPVIESIAQKLDVNPDWLVLKTDDMGSFNQKDEWYKGNLLNGTVDNLANGDDSTNLVDKYDNIRPIRLKRFPLLGEIACGEPIWADEDKESYVMADMDIRADFCLTAKGDSMINARIYDGDVVFIREMPMVENGEIAAVIIGDEATLKRWYYDRDNNKLVLMAENPAYPPLVYINEELNTIRCLGKAVYFMSSL